MTKLPPESLVKEETLQKLAAAAWEVRENAHVYGGTKVGCALLSEGGTAYVSCNVEQRFRSHDVHAEVSAITAMVAAGEKRVEAIIIVAERERFTPCGACLDWIFQFGGENCVVAYQTRKGGALVVHRAHELMPYYPR